PPAGPARGERGPKPPARPSDQCTDETEARPTGDAPGRSIAASTAAVQSPAAGRGTTSTVNRPDGARVIHSSTADEWSFSSTSTRERAGTVMSLAAVAPPQLTDEIKATSSASALISRAAARRARSYWAAGCAGSISQGCPLRATPARPASWVAMGKGLQEAALR